MSCPLAQWPSTGQPYHLCGQVNAQGEEGAQAVVSRQMRQRRTPLRRTQCMGAGIWPGKQPAVRTEAAAP